MRRGSGSLIVFILIILPLFIAVTPLPAASVRQYTFAVIPNAPPLTLHKRWTPFVERLSKDTGIEIKLKLYDSIEKFLDACRRGEPDFIYAAPNMYYQAHEKQGYRALLRSSANFRGMVFVRSDSPVNSVQELSGKSVGFVGPSNLCSVIVRDQFLKGDNPVKVNKSFAGSTINVAKAVLMKKVDAGATLDINFEKDFPELKPQLKIIYETPEVASHPIAVHPRISRKLQETVGKGILAFDKTESGKALLSQAGFISPIKADFIRDYSVYKDIDQPSL